MNTPNRRVHTEVPGPRSRERMSRGTFDMQSFYRAFVVDDASSRGTTLVDADGNHFLDLFSSFALGALGYNHPALVRTAQSPGFVRAAINPTSQPFMPTEGWIDVMDRLETLAAPRGLERIFCVDAGGEGVDSAMKAAFIVHAEERRQRAGLPRDPLAAPAEQIAGWMGNAGTDAVIITFDGAFHGRGLAPMSASHSKPIHKADLPAFPWPSAPFPAHRWPRERFAEENARAEAAALEQLGRLLDANAGRVAGIMVEVVQSEGGDRHTSPAFIRRVQQLAAQAGAAFIVDEVQTGVAVTGTLWAHEQLDLPHPPDLVTFGKKMQMGGFFASPRFDIRQFGRMYQTRNGDRARAMLAVATLEAIHDEGLLANVREVGALFLHHLTALGERFPSLVSDPRGMGFLLAFDLPTPRARDEFLTRCRARGVLGTYTGTRSVRLRPHLITTAEEVEEAARVFAAVLAEMES